MDQAVQRCGTGKRTKKVLIPGDPERELEAERMQNGIPLLEPVTEDLKALGKKLGVTWEQND